jgi:[ribosomal protein S5]-alanine N-acetyltransferase
MTKSPTLETARLKLRPYSNDDIAELLPLIGAPEVAATTLRIPHPYTVQDAREFIAATQTGSECLLAIALRADGHLIGGVGLRIIQQHRHAELGYWLGVPYWRQGYATEAAREMVRYGFEHLRLHRIFASYFKGNDASRRVLERLGMRYEGCQREHVCKWDRFIDSELYGMLRPDWNTQTDPGS